MRINKHVQNRGSNAVRVRYVALPRVWTPL
jgi:hypothetical protein